ncbi:MAG: cytochrome c biogenesis protein CcdA [Vicinamibacteraceae bacterium]|nr:cytochrome c biogenesis protein CcdA [Vicinamibacteraceae bacterium]
MEHVSLLAAFVAGVLSFISPCVLPLVPGYLSFVSGVSLDQMRASGGDASRSRSRVFIASLAFVVGFSMVFVALGASASAIGQFLMERLSLLGKIAGVVIILFGLHMMGVLRITWLYSQARVETNRKPAGPLGAMLVGIAFAFGWTPCIGPILAAILAVAASRETVAEGVQLLGVYSAGLGVPFLLTSLAVDRFFAAFARIRKHYHLIEITSGVLLVGIGVLMVTNRLTLIAQYLTPYLPTF